MRGSSGWLPSGWRPNSCGRCPTTERARLLQAMPGLKPRAKTLVELADRARFYVVPRPIPRSGDAAKMLDA